MRFCFFFFCFLLIVCFFFFQAEDGIRDRDGWLEFRRVLFRSLTIGWFSLNSKTLAHILKIWRYTHIILFKTSERPHVAQLAPQKCYVEPCFHRQRNKSVPPIHYDDGDDESLFIEGFPHGQNFENCLPSVWVLFNPGKIGKYLIKRFNLHKRLSWLQTSFRFENSISENYSRDDKSY